MKTWLLVSALGGVIGVGYWLYRYLSADDHVSAAWHVDNSRREWGTGIEQSCVREWPISKIPSETGWWNRRKYQVKA